LYFDEPKTDLDSGIMLRYGDDVDASEEGAGFLKHFWPKLSSAQIVKKVEVRAWNPEKKEVIVGTAEQAASKLGNKDAAAASQPFGSTETFTVDHPVATVDEANELAKGQLAKLNMEFITGAGEARGNPELKPGVVIKITVNPDEATDRFNGKYMVVGTTHRYSTTGSDDTGGYSTQFRVRRDAHE